MEHGPHENPPPTPEALVKKDPHRFHSAGGQVLFRVGTRWVLCNPRRNPGQLFFSARLFRLFFGNNRQASVRKRIKSLND